MSAAAVVEEEPPPALKLLSERPGPAPQAGTRAVPVRRLDAESRAWWDRLHGAEPVRDCAIAELHPRLRREAWFYIRLRDQPGS